MKKVLKSIILNFFSLFKIKNIIVLESVPVLTDNAKALYDYLIDNGYNKKYKIIWFTDNTSQDKVIEKNVKIVKVWKPLGGLHLIGAIKYCYYLKNAKYIFYCNRNVHKLNQKTLTVFLNHGIPLKNVKDIKIVSPKVDYLISPSEFFSEMFKEQYHVSRDKIIELGTPRNDLMFNYVKKDKKFDFVKNTKKVILWMPTFRDHRSGTRSDSTFSFPLGIPIVYNFDSLKKLDEVLKEQDTLLLIKPHPVQDMSKIKDIELDNIKLINDDDLKRNNLFLFEFFFYVDAILTDYSGVYYDALLTDKPIGFTIDDFKEYNETRGFPFEDPLEKMAGMKIVNMNDLFKFIKDTSNNCDLYQEDRIRIKKLFFDKLDGKTCERIIKYFKF